MENDFNIEVILENKHITAKTKSYKNETKTNFHYEGLQLEQNLYLTYLLTLIASVN